MKNRLLTFLVSTLLLTFSYEASKAQNGIVESVVVNGGFFEFAPPYQDYVTITMRSVFNEVRLVDTIYTQSAQDILVDTSFVFVAAQDSIVQYNHSMERLNKTAFGAPSTVKLAVYKNYLIVGNWYGSSNNNLRIFNKNDLSFVDSIPEIQYGAKDFVVFRDSLFIQQNLTNSLFEDSAGFLSVVDLNNLQFVRNIELNNSNEELGKLIQHQGTIYGFNSNSNSISRYNIINGTSNQTSLTADLQVGVYGQQLARYFNDFYFIADGGIKKMDITTFSIDNQVIVDSATAFVLDTLQEEFIVTKTDFGSYSYASSHLIDGTLLENFKVGYAPEVIGAIYGTWGGIDFQKESSLKVYPNPFSNKISFDLGISKGELKIYNLQGALIYEETGVTGKVNLELDNMPTGLYRAVFNSNGIFYSSNIVKTK